MSARRIIFPTRSLLTTVRRRSITTSRDVISHPSAKPISYHPQRLTTRGFVSTFPTYEKAAPAEGAAVVEGAEEEENPCPPWQNPLHHNNPEFEKVFEEDFEPGEEMPTVPLPPFSSPDSNVDAPPHIHDLANEIIHLNLMELAQLMDRIGEHFGFDDSAFGGDVGDGDGEGDAAGEEAKEEKTTFDLKLEGFDAKAKIKVIKEIRALTGLGLKEAKELVEGAPTNVKKDIKMEEAEELKAKLEAAGATVSIA